MGSRWCLYGYEFINDKFVVNTEESEIVRSIFEKYLSGYSLKKIADELAFNKVLYFKEKDTWNKNMVSRILENKHYIGDETYPQIIDERLYEQVIVLKRNKGGERIKDSEELKFIKDKLYCSNCGSKYIRKTLSYKQKEKWYCSNSCKCSQYIDDGFIYNRITSIIKSVIDNPELLKINKKVSLSYVANLEIIKKENELAYDIEHGTKNFRDLAEDVLSLIPLKFDCCSECIDIEYTDAFIEYLNKYKNLQNFDAVFLNTIVKKIYIETNAGIAIVFSNDVILTYEERRNKYVAC